MAKIIIFLTLYVIVPPGIFVFARFLKEQAKYAIFGRRRSSTAIKQAEQKEGLNKKINKRIRFTMSDPRNEPIPFRLIFIFIYLIGAGLSIYSGFSDSWKLLLISMLIAYIAVIFSYATANKIVIERDKVIKRMLDLKGSKMRFVNKEKGAMVTPETEFKILKWDEDLISPTKMHLYMPTDFDILEVDRFLESFNLVFGGNGQWIADDTDKEYQGFDFNAGVAAIKVSPKLPPIAMWHERYIDPKHIHWSYFPLALGSENGVPIFNEDEGATEHVLGFAVNGGQEKLSKKNGVQLGPEITSAPQVLIEIYCKYVGKLAYTGQVYLLAHETELLEHPKAI